MVSVETIRGNTVCQFYIQDYLIPEEISSLWRSLTAGALDCILLVTSIGRYSAEEVKMVEFITQNLFEGKGLLQERILIVITRSESYLIDDKSEAKKWLEKESKNEVFRHYLNLVKNDTNSGEQQPTAGSPSGGQGFWK